MTIGRAAVRRLDRGDHVFRSVIPDGLLLSDGVPAEARRRLVANGILRPDDSINEEPAPKPGRDMRKGWNASKPAPGTSAP